MPRIKSLDIEPADHKKYLRRYISSFKRVNRRAGENYESFVEKLFGIFSDHPTISWRFVVTTYKYPVFLVFNRRTGRLNDFLYVTKTWGLYIASKFLNDKYDKLFPEKGAWYGRGDGVYLDYSSFGEKKQLKYINAITDIISTSNDITINYAAHVRMP